MRRVALFRRLTATAITLFVTAASAAPDSLTCKWTHPKHPGRTQTLTMTVDSTYSTVTHSKGATNSIAFTPAEIKFKVRGAGGIDWGYVLNRTTLTWTETNFTIAGDPIDYVCEPVKPKV